jgi:hypothetical protein
MSKEQQRQLSALLRRGRADPVPDSEGLECRCQIDRQDLGDPGPSGRAARTARPRR